MSSLIQKVTGGVGDATKITKTVAPGLLQKTSSIAALDDFSSAALSNIDEVPIPVYQYKIVMASDPEDKPIALFQTLSGMSVTRSVEEVAVGGLNHYGNEFPGQVSFGHVTFGAGLTSSEFFWKWMMEGSIRGYAKKLDFTLIQRRPNPLTDPAETDVFPVVKRWTFKNAFPVSWKISDLDLDDSQKIVIESLELSFDEFHLPD